MGGDECLDKAALVLSLILYVHGDSVHVVIQRIVTDNRRQHPNEIWGHQTEYQTEPVSGPVCLSG